jgi:hypothetical protein
LPQFEKENMKAKKFIHHCFSSKTKSWDEKIYSSVNWNWIRFRIVWLHIDFRPLCRFLFRPCISRRRNSWISRIPSVIFWSILNVWFTISLGISTRLALGLTVLRFGYFIQHRDFAHSLNYLTLVAIIMEKWFRFSLTRYIRRIIANHEHFGWIDIQSPLQFDSLLKSARRLTINQCRAVRGIES